MNGHHFRTPIIPYASALWNKSSVSHIWRNFSTFCLWAGLVGLGTLSMPMNGFGGSPGERESPLRHIRTVIPILGTTVNEYSEPVGIVAEITLEFTHRRDHQGLEIRFENTPGKFSPFAQQSVVDAIERVAEAAGLNSDSWSVRFILPYPGVTLYGESLSAMAALNVIALAKNEPVYEDTVLTGTVTPEGALGVVGGVPLKIHAAHERKFRKVVIPEELDIADGDWETPFLMEVTPVRSIKKAYFVLTHHALRSLVPSPSIAVALTP